MAMQKGIRIHQYLDAWLVRARSNQICLQHTQGLAEICQKLGWMVNLKKIRAETQANFRLRRLPVGPQVWLGPTHIGPVTDPPTKTDRTTCLICLSGLASCVRDRSANSHRERSSPWLPTHETHTMASQKPLEGSGITRKSQSSTQVFAPLLKWWLEESNMLQGQPLHPVKLLCRSLQMHQKKGGVLT